MKKRSEGFFGLHFDFHAGDDCTEIGKKVTEEMIRDIIETLNPDFIQCDCKGHRGFSSYKTKAGNQAPGFINDQLKIWRKVTKEYGVPLIMHYSGIWDTRALEFHPEWAVLNEDGSPDKEKTSPFKDYADKLLIPQLLELADVYGVDGVWVDGECWAVKPDFDERVINLFEKEYGVKLVKDSEGKYDKKSAEYRKFLDFNRNQFLKYIEHYAAETHKNAPDFEIASNWAFSSHMPQKVCVTNIDFLSGDFNPDDSYNSARFEARILCEQNKPWDLMAWGFNRNFTGNTVKSIKSPETLCREAASVISLGGGFQIYNNQNRDGSVNLWEVRELKPVAEFMREREPFLKGSRPFSNIGILYSDYDRKNKIEELFPYGWNEQVKGAVRIVLDSAHSCGILMDYMLEPEYKSFAEKDIIIVPELKYINGEIKDKLLKFAENGGNLIISGYNGCKLFADVLNGAEIDENCRETVIQIVNGERNIHQKAVYGDVRVNDNAYNTDNSEVLRKCSTGKPVITKTKYGNGNIVAVYYNIFDIYYDAPNFYVRNMMSEIIDSLDCKKFIKYKGLKFIDIVPAEKDGKLLLNLINTIEVYSEKRLRAYDEIPDLTNIEITLKLEKKPTSVKLQPKNIIPEYKYDASTKELTVNIEKLHIHSIIVIE